MPASPSWLTVDYQRESFVFRLAGLPVYTHYSFAFTALFMTSPLWFQGRLASIAVAVLLMAIVFLSILAHELGHVYAARAQRARARSIEIGMYGGLAELEWDYHRGLAMRPVALSGPMVNLLLAGLFFALYWLVAEQLSAEELRYTTPFSQPGVLARTAYLAAWLNLGLAFVNLLPAFPLDGGTIVQDVLAGRLGQRRASLIVGCCGVVLAGVSGVVAFVSFLAGVPILAPPSLAPNLAAVQENWRGPKTEGLRKTRRDR